MAGGPAPFLLLLLAAGSCTASSAGARHAPALPRVTWWRKSSISLVAGDDAAPVLAVEGLAVWPGFSSARRHGDGDGDGGYESTPLLSGVAFKVCAGERVAVVGPNGCGKTSLLRVLAGLRAPATGQVVTRPGVSVGYLPQEFLELVRGDGRTAEEMVAGALAAAEGAGRATGTPAFAEAEVEAEAVSGLAAAAEALETEAKAKAAAAEAETQVLADARRLAVARAQLHELGFGDDLCERAARDLSHGWATRLGLACALVPQPALVLLDEPTNHVDLLALEWLERFLCGPRLRGCACVLVSHDREFVDRVATAVLAVEAGRTRLFRGGYRQYVALRRLQEEAQKERRARGVSTQALRQAVDASATGRKGRGVAAGEGRARGGHGGGDDDDDDEVLWDGEGAQASTKRKAKPWEAMRGVGDAGGARRGRPSAMRFRIPPAPACPDHLGGLQGCTFRYDGAQTPVVRNATMALFRGDRVGIIGANGAGKSTLLRLLLGDLMPTTGSAGLAGVKAVAASETGVPGQAARKVRADQVLETLAEAEANAKTTTKIEAQARVRPFFFAQNLADRIDGRLTLVEALLAGPDSILTATQGQGRGEGDNFVPWERAPMAVDGRCRRASTADDCEGGGEDADDAVGNSAAEARAHRLLTKMRFARGTHDRLVSSLSCGERARLVLCMMLQSSANVLVLDEPTNHLDIETVERLEEALRYFDGSLVVASHDRFFVAETTRTVVVMGTGDEGELQVFQGGWAEYSAAADVAWRGAAAVGARRAADTHFVAARQHAPKMVTVDGHFFDGTGRRLARARRRDERRPIKRQGTLKRMKRARRRNIGQPKKDSKGEAGTMRP